MKILNVTQGSEEWKEARLGIPTASQFHRILTPKTMKPSGQQDDYLAELVTEWFFGHPADEAASQFMERGRDLEEEAVAWYEFDRSLRVERVGFCLTDDGKAGCSPDGLVGDEGGLEIKCPSAKVHTIYTMRGLEDEYKCQVQGALWVTGRAWWDLLSYHPAMTPIVRRVERDEKFVNALGEEVAAFVERLERMKADMADRKAEHDAQRTAPIAEADLPAGIS